MLAKLTSKNQLTLPKAATQALGPVEYLDVEVRAGQLVLTPVRLQRADAVRAKLAALRLDDDDLAAAVMWARNASAAAPKVRVAETIGGYSRVPARKRAAAPPLAGAVNPIAARAAAGPRTPKAAPAKAGPRKPSKPTGRKRRTP